MKFQTNLVSKNEKNLKKVLTKILKVDILVK